MSKLSKPWKILLWTVFILCTIGIFLLINTRVCSLINPFTGYTKDGRIPTAQTISFVLSEVNIVIFIYTILAILCFVAKLKPRSILYPVSIITMEYLFIIRQLTIDGRNVFLILGLSIPFIGVIIISFVLGLIFDIKHARKEKD